MFAQLECLCCFAHDVKKLFGVRGKLAVSSDLSSNLSDTQKTARLESTRKINLKYDLHKNTASVKNQASCFIWFQCLHLKNNHSKIVNHFPVAQYLSTTRNQCVIRFLVGVQKDTI